MDRARLILLATVIVTGAAWLGTTFAVPAAERGVVTACVGVAALVVCAAVTVAAYAFESARRLRERVTTTEAELMRLADDTLPAVVKRLRSGASGDTALAEVEQPDSDPQLRILQTLVDAVGRGERMRAAAMSACANAAGRVQALATSMLADLREMENRHDEEVLGDLLRLDHSTAQAGRLADSIAVLTGARSGRRWTKPIVMESVLRGAVGRISAYQRVRIHSTSTVAIAGYAAEGVMHALAELMDNATSFSPPSEDVHVYVEEVYAGVVVTIEDGGLTMSPSALERAERTVSSEALDLTTLSGTRLGLAVVGCLARKHGMTVSFRPSSRGGTGVVVLIPRQLITQGRPGTAPAASRASGVAARVAGAAPVTEPATEVPSPAEAEDGATVTPDATPVGLTASEPDSARWDADPLADKEAGGPTGTGEVIAGLPRRRRGETLAAAPRSAAAADAEPAAPAKPATDPGERFRAFREAGRRGGAGGGVPAPAPDDA
ncbi:ATP-binding protein [Actinoallomurus bryophytorum]|uniref:histidine kinase n=1 Tax=Actinoallomurus bryophytorum TaxID=1490222 RepID=A0A543CQ88_9ACTN|nr:ATP-binding protein [Actinoallomurus bryophytorum]TQL99255.1 histidine kinase/DNA gyrase B/HSP90-like ATPase [Actinoallomurus bryophytorum]